MHPFKREKLSNGIKLISFQNQAIHSVQISLCLPAGPLYEPAELNGISHLLEHMVFRRMRDYTQEELYDGTERIGGTLRGVTYQNYMEFSICVVSKYFTKALTYFPQILLPVDWSKEDIAKEKAVVIKQIDHRPSDGVVDIEERRYFSNQPNGYPIIGSRSKVLQFSKKQIYNWRDLIFRTDQATVILCGNFSNADLEQAKVQLGSIPSLGGNYRTIAPSILPKEFTKRSEKSDLIMSTEWDFSDIVVSFDVDIHRYTFEEMQLLSNMFGRGDGCWISQILREQEGLTDEVNAYVNHYGQLMRLKIETTVNQCDLEKTLRLLFKELLRFRTEDLTIPFMRTRPFFTDNQYQLLDNPSQMSEFLIFREMFSQPVVSSLEDMINPYLSITAAHMSACANRLFRPENLVVAVSNNPKWMKARTLRMLLQDLRRQLF